MGHSTICLEAVSKVFHKPSRLVALKKITRSFAPGSLTIITGHNGAGKSTLFRVIAGLMRADDGKLTIEPTVRIGFFSSNLHLYGNLTVSESVQLFRQSTLTSPENLQLLVNERSLLEFIGAKNSSATVRSLSKGQQIRLSLAIALHNGQDLLLLDEPTTHLDKDGIARIVALLQKHPATVIIATHDPELFAGIERTVETVKMNQGEFVE